MSSNQYITVPIQANPRQESPTVLALDGGYSGCLFESIQLETMHRKFLCLAVGALFTLSACTTVNLQPDGPAKSATPAQTSAAKSSSPEKKSPFKPWKDVMKDTKAMEGLFTTHLKRDQTVFFELMPGDLDKDFGMVMHFSQGTGVFNLHDGLPLSDMRLMRFNRVGDTIYLVHRNSKFVADEGSPMANSLEGNTGHSVIGAYKIATEDTSKKSLVIDVTSLFVSDYSQLGERIKPYYGGKPVSFDKTKSFVKDVMAFPENIEVDATLSFRASGRPQSTSAGVSDYRSVPVGVRYSFVKLPEDPMMPRYADDRVGHFLDAVRDFSRDQEATPYVRFVNRWRLEKKDPEAERSEPVKPITFYLDHSIPEQYKPYVKEGIEAWNKAYDAAGFINAIVAVDAPDDPNWSAEDARYSTVRWTAAHSMGYAIGPSQSDPRTGELLNADILISSTFVTGWNNEYLNLIGPNGLLEQYENANLVRESMSPELAARMCLAEMGKTHELGFQHAALSALGVISGTEPMPEEYLGNAIRDLIMHEVGHTIGMRHNFKGSSAIPVDKLNDTDFTSQHGLSLSVMDYAPTNISSDRDKQGHYVNMEVGSYDVWAIRYAYEPMYVTGTGTNGDVGSISRLAETPEEELPGLRAIAEQAAHPMHAYNTDEDTHRGPMSVDPLSNTWDLSGDPLEYAKDRNRLVDLIQPVIEDRIIDDGEGYQQLRGAINRLMFERYRGLVPVTKNIGGLYFARDHKGDPNGRSPFTPVPVAKQREAMQLIVDQALSEGSFPVDADALNKMAPNRFSDWANSVYSGNVDFPIHEAVLSMQASLLGQLVDNGRMARMINNGARSPGGTYTVAEMLQTLTGSIWSEVVDRPRNADSFRRNLQLHYVDALAAVMNNLRPRPSIPPAPDEARAIARLELRELSNSIDAALGASGLDRTMQAHLFEAKARIDNAFALSATKVVK